MMRRVRALFGLLLVGCGSGGTRGGPVWIDREADAMGSTLKMTLEAPDLHAAVSASEAVLSAVGAADALLSPRRPDSRVSELNAIPVGATAPIDEALCRTLREVDLVAGLTPGAFDPVIGSLVEAWGLDGDGRVPSVVELEAARRAAGAGGMTFDLVRCLAQRLASAAAFEPWGFVKGYALRGARDSLLAHGVHSARLQFGDQVLVLGPSAHGGGPWHVSIASPEDTEGDVFTLWLANGSASTSSQSSRFVRAAGQTIGDILDPRSGTPVPAWGSLTVVAQDPMRADVLSTALFVLGPDSALVWAGRHPEVGVLVLNRRDGASRPRWNEGLRPALDSATSTPLR
jgi:thiamine biosynthesis lipoprotein